MTECERIELSGCGEPREMIRIEHPVEGQLFDKWIALVGDEVESAVGIALCRREVAEAVLPRLQQALASLEHVPGEQQHLGLRTAPDAAALELAREVGGTSIFTRGGRFPCPDRREPIAVIDMLPIPAGFRSLQDYAHARISHVAETKWVRIEEARPVKIDGMRGLELVGSAEDAATSQPLVMYQVTLLGKGSICVMLGLAGAELRPSCVPAFRQLAESIRGEPRGSHAKDSADAARELFVAD